MKKRLTRLTPLVILGGLLLAAVIIRSNPPEGDRRPPSNGPQIVVEALTISPAPYQVKLQSYGTVQPRTRSMLVAQVGGQIIWVDDSLRSGGFFEQGDALARIDPRDYEADVRIAEATLMDARQALAEAEARTNQARKDWERLGNEGDAPELVLRLPQLEAAKARVSSARSSLQKAKLDLERTRIVAPYSGRILRKFVDIGQVVSPSTQLAEIYASDYVEVRLPLKNRDLRFIDLPESYRGTPADRQARAAVEIRSELGGDARWQAELKRTEGAIDESARQLHVIAQVDDPFGQQQDGGPPLKIGQYVTAELAGIVVEDAIVIPNGAIYQGSYTYVVEDGLLRRRDVEIAWQNQNEALIRSGLRAGDRLVTTPLGQVTSGIRVSVAGEERRPDRLGARSTAGKPGENTP